MLKLKTKIQYIAIFVCAFVHKKTLMLLPPAHSSTTQKKAPINIYNYEYEAASLKIQMNYFCLQREAAVSRGARKWKQNAEHN